MAKHRLLNCEFINATSFKNNLSNRAKLLYLMMFTNADDKGFVDTVQDLINALEKNDNELDKVERLELLENTYNTAINELIDKGLIYRFNDNHNNKIYLIRHWFYHNKLVKGLWTCYRNFLELVHLENNEYILNSVKKPLKEDKININQDKLNQDMVSIEPTETEETEQPNEDNDMSWLLDK